MEERPENESFRQEKQVEAPATIGEAGKRRWLYPDRRPGPRATLRSRVALGLILFYFIVPWINIGDRPLLRLDVQGQYASLFGFVLKMNEYNMVFFILAAMGIFLFLVTSLRGRVWCGYACPQTVFVEWVIRPIEELIEGPALRRRKRDGEPMTMETFLKKALKQFLFIAVSAVVANAFLGLFVDPRKVVHWMVSPPSQHPTAFAFVMGLTFLMYFDLAWFREQFCSFLCPYARFQSVLLDDSSPTVTYDKGRGEPRGKQVGSGDCIDCGLCTRVCPTGIDIRNGLQLECIQCMRCVDACDSIMANLKRPIGLIKVISQSDLRGQERVAFYRRPRVLLYMGLLTIIIVGGALRAYTRDPIAVTFLRQTGSPYGKLDDGRISNLFNMRAINHEGTEGLIKIEVADSSPGVEVLCPGCAEPIAPFGEKVSPVIIILGKEFTGQNVRLRVVGGTAVQELPIIRP